MVDQRHKEHLTDYFIDPREESLLSVEEEVLKSHTTFITLNVTIDDREISVWDMSRLIDP